MKKLLFPAIKFIFNCEYRKRILIYNGYYDKMSDEEYLKLRYKLTFGKKLDLENPKTFNEKLQWLKLYNRKPEYTTMVDKFKVREYIAKKIGKEYLIPSLGVWDSPDEIDFDSLPNRFVLKCNHNSGLGMCICKDKSKLDIEKVKNELRKGLAEDYYLNGREWPYKNVPRKVIAEKYMEDGSASELRDYKFFCFNGKVRFLYLSQGLDNHETARISYVTLDWEKAEFYRDDYKVFDTLPPKPINFDKMVKLAENLSKGIPFLRVDFYEVNQKIYFGELTFYPGAGLTKYTPEKWDNILGSWIELPDKKG